MKRMTISICVMSALVSASLGWSANLPPGDVKADKTALIKGNNHFACDLK